MLLERGIEYLECTHVGCPHYKKHFGKDAEKNWLTDSPDGPSKPEIDTSEIIEKTFLFGYNCRISSSAIDCHIVEGFNNDAKMIRGMIRLLEEQNLSRPAIMRTLDPKSI